MKFFNKKIIPSLVDQNVIGEYMKQKFPDPVRIIHLPPKEPSDLEKLFTKIIYNFLQFFYHYFFIITVLVIIIIYFYRRFTWYQQIKKLKDEDDKKNKESKEIKQYFDKILSDENTQPSLEANYLNSNPKLINYLTSSQSKDLQNISKQNTVSNYVPGGKIDNMISNNNGYLNHLKQSLTTLTPNFDNFPVSNNKIGLATKSVRFAPGEFDAFGRNNINPKTGEIFAFNNDVNNYSLF